MRKYELYNLIEDISERTELSEKQPEKVKELEATMMSMLIDMKAIIPHTPK